MVDKFVKKNVLKTTILNQSETEEKRIKLKEKEKGYGRVPNNYIQKKINHLLPICYIEFLIFCCMNVDTPTISTNCIPKKNSLSDKKLQFQHN